MLSLNFKDSTSCHFYYKQSYYVLKASETTLELAVNRQGVISLEFFFFKGFILNSKLQKNKQTGKCFSGECTDPKQKCQKLHFHLKQSRHLQNGLASHPNRQAYLDTMAHPA